MRIASTLVAFLLLAGVVAGGGLDEYKSLEEHTQLSITVLVDEAGKEMGLKASTIERFATKELTTAGIQVLPELGPGVLWMVISIDVLKLQGIYPFTIEVAAFQPVRVIKNGQVLFSPTWRRTHFGLTSKSRLPVIKDGIQEALAAFIADWEKAHQPVKDPFDGSKADADEQP